jgi:DNA segregation ATPase FtsK/SpoIIIE-like protein
MLYYPQSMAKPQRGQGAFVTDGEVEAVIDYLKAQNMGTYDPKEAEAIVSASSGLSGESTHSKGEDDELLPQAVDIVLMAGTASVSILQRRMNIGYPRAARLIDVMQEKGYIGSFEGSKPRKLLINQTQWLEIQARKGD